jgi:hypothetical protein
MTLLRALSAVVIGLSSLSLGCSDEIGSSNTSGAPEIDDPFYSTMAGPPGTGGTNNLNPPDFHGLKYTLFSAAELPLATYGADDQLWWLANNAPNSALLGSIESRNVIKYAVRCALSTTSTVHAELGSSVLSYPGQGILGATSAWKTTPLNLDQANDLFTCMLAHLNARGVEVPINLSGPNINNALGSDPAFSWDEALWATKIDLDPVDGAVFSFYVWPLDNLVDCPGYVSGLEDRVCGTFQGECGLTVRSDRETACTETETGWFCEDTTGHPLPAIKTRLKAKDASALYDGCL